MLILRNYGSFCMATYDAKIEFLFRKLDETVSDLIEEIVEADDYLTELTKKRYTIEFFINQSTIHSNSLASPMATTTPQNGHVFPTQSTPPQSHNTNSHRLPKLALPVFNGNVLKWQTFWDSYKVAIHENFMSKRQKLQKSNYSQCIEILEQRFGQPHKKTNAHMQALLDLPCQHELHLWIYYMSKFLNTSEFIIMINSRHILNLSIELITKPQALGRTSCYKCNGTKREAGRAGVVSLSCF